MANVREMAIVRRKLVTIQGCPVFNDIGPYIAVVVNDAYSPRADGHASRQAKVDSIYRGDDARAILNKHGKHSQEQLYWLSRFGTPAERDAVGLPPEGGGANPPGRSTHELRSDGTQPAWGPAGARLAWWMQGFDVLDRDVSYVIRAAHRHGWDLFRPYSSGNEYHHLNFRSQPARPRVGSAMWNRIWRIRLTLPSS